MGAADFRLLGPLTITVDNRPVRVSADKQRVVLGVLLIQANQVVTTDRLLHELWLGTPPKSGIGTLQSLVSRLRRLVGAPDVRLEGGASGYRLSVAPEALDTFRFERLGKDGCAYAAEGRAGRAAETLSAALGMWQGQFLLEVPQTPLIAAEAARLGELRINLTERRVEMDLRLGRHADLVAELRSLVAEHPYREGLWHQLMYALYRSGRVQEALEAFRSARELFVGEFGLEPGDSLRTLHLEILRGSVTPLRGPAEPVRITAPAPPRQLPPSVRDFVGREAELAAIDRHLRPVGRSLPLVVVSGMAGAGKTALAVRAAHEVMERFPDGQLFVDLGGRNRRPADPADVLSRLLGSLGVPERAIPPDLTGRADLFRSRLSGQRVLLVLDDAADEAQAEPLLPGSPSCAVIVTGRGRLAMLEGAGRVEVGPLRRAESIRFLVGALDGERTPADPEAVAALAELCADLPLSLRICAAHLTSNPHWMDTLLDGRAALRGPDAAGCAVAWTAASPAGLRARP